MFTKSKISFIFPDSLSVLDNKSESFLSDGDIDISHLMRNPIWLQSNIADPFVEQSSYL